MRNPLTMKLEQFSSFTPAERQLLDGLLAGRGETYARGETILHEGQKVDQIHLVASGLAARSKTLEDGGRQLMAFLIPGDLCDVEVFVLDAMDHDIIALTPTTCILIAAEKMQGLLTQSGDVTRALWWSTMTDSAVLREWIVGHGRRDASERMAHLFCELLVRYRIVGQAEDNRFDFPLTQEELASATGMTPVHVNRVLQQLRSDSLIELSGKSLEILDFAGLREAAQFESAYLHLIRTERGDPAVRARAGDLIDSVSGSPGSGAPHGLASTLTRY
jgi:CRP-like cAMP-binding protein